jgi:hypothetical protein
VFEDSALRGCDDSSLGDGFQIFRRNIVPIFKGLGVREHLQTLEDEDSIFPRIVNRLARDKISGPDRPAMGVMSLKEILKLFSYFS